MATKRQGKMSSLFFDTSLSRGDNPQGGIALHSIMKSKLFWLTMILVLSSLLLPACRDTSTDNESETVLHASDYESNDNFIDSELSPSPLDDAGSESNGLIGALSPHDYAPDTLEEADIYQIPQVDAEDGTAVYDSDFEVLETEQCDDSANVVVVSYVGSIHADLPKMRFDIIDSYQYDQTPTLTLTTISISWHETGALIQQIDGDNAGRPIYSTIGKPGENIEIIDMNFDGYKDIILPLRWYRAAWSECWLYDPEAGQFAYLDANLFRVGINAENQIISSDEGRLCTYHKFVDGVLTLIKQERLGIWIYGENGESLGVFDIMYELVDEEWVEVDRQPTRLRGG